MQFASVQTGSTAHTGGAEATLEVVLRTRERLRIGASVNVAAFPAWCCKRSGMIHLQASVRVCLCLTACDMRKAFDSLHLW